MVGLPASGKTTAREQAASTGPAADSFHYSPDDWLDAKAEELGSTYSEVWEKWVKTATIQMDAGLRDAIKKGKNVLWDQTNMSDKKRRQILKKFEGKDYYAQCLCILPPFTEAQETELARRLQSRPGKTIPDFVMQGMRKSFVLPTTDEGFEKVLYFDINGRWVDTADAQKIFGDTLEKG
jgi:hypothetical protein